MLTQSMRAVIHGQTDAAWRVEGGLRKTCPPWPTACARVSLGRQHAIVKLASTSQFYSLLDHLDIDALLELKVNASGVRGIFALESVERSPVCSVPVGSLLVVPADALGTGYLKRHQEGCGALPPALIELLTDAPDADVEGLPYLRLAAWLLWLRNRTSYRSEDATAAAPAVQATSADLQHPELLSTKKPASASSGGGDAPAQPFSNGAVIPTSASSGGGAADGILNGFRQYLAMLPAEDAMSCLLSYNQQESEELQVSQAVEEAGRQRGWAEALHREWLSSKTGHLRSLSLAGGLECSLWALAQARSRSVAIHLRSGHKVTLLAPIIDLANHSPQPNCLMQLSSDDTRLQMLPTRLIASGQEVTLDYGHQRDNLDLMCDYGFCLPGNANDRVVLADAATLPPLDLGRVQSAYCKLVAEVEPTRGAAYAGQDAGASNTTSTSTNTSTSGQGSVKAARLAAAVASIQQLHCDTVLPPHGIKFGDAPAAEIKPPTGPDAGDESLPEPRHTTAFPSTMSIAVSQPLGGGSTSGLNQRLAVSGQQHTAAVQQWLLYCQQYLKRLGTTVQEDLDILKSGSRLEIKVGSAGGGTGRARSGAGNRGSVGGCAGGAGGMLEHSAAGASDAGGDGAQLGLRYGSQRRYFQAVRYRLEHKVLVLQMAQLLRLSCDQDLAS